MYHHDSKSGFYCIGSRDIDKYISFSYSLIRTWYHGIKMKKEEILALIGKAGESDDAVFQKIIVAVLDGKFLTVKDLACELDASILTIERWRDGKTSLHPFIRKIVYKRIVDMLKCTCPGRVCDCQNPPPVREPKSGVWHVSETCRKHNAVEDWVTDPECPVCNTAS